MILKHVYKSPNQCRLVCRYFNESMCKFLYSGFKNVITNEESYNFLINRGYKLSKLDEKHILRKEYMSLLEHIEYYGQKEILNSRKLYKYYVCNEVSVIDDSFVKTSLIYLSISEFKKILKVYEQQLIAINGVHHNYSKDCTDELIKAVEYNFENVIKLLCMRFSSPGWIEITCNLIHLSYDENIIIPLILSKNVEGYKRISANESYFNVMTNIVHKDLLKENFYNFDIMCEHNLLKPIYFHKEYSPKVLDKLILTTAIVFDIDVLTYAATSSDEVFKVTCDNMKKTIDCFGLLKDRI